MPKSAARVPNWYWTFVGHVCDNFGEILLPTVDQNSVFVALCERTNCVTYLEERTIREAAVNEANFAVTPLNVCKYQIFLYHHQCTLLQLSEISYGSDKRCFNWVRAQIIAKEIEPHVTHASMSKLYASEAQVLVD